MQALSDIPKKRGSALHFSLSIPQGFALFLGQEMRQFQAVFLNKIGNPQKSGRAVSASWFGTKQEKLRLAALIACSICRSEARGL